MYKIASFIFLSVLMSFSVFAQKEKTPALSDFSGTWILDEEKSFRNPDEREHFEDYTLVISQTEPETKIVQTYSFRGKPSEYTIKLFTDKRGEENKYVVRKFSESGLPNNFYWLEDVDIKSKTFAKNGKIVRQGSCSSVCENPFVIKETYSLSKDGITLTLTTEKTSVVTIASSNNSSSATYRFFFNKKE